MTAPPQFTLADIPEDWEIELDADFVKFLDRLNRPWHYDEKGNYVNGRKGLFTHTTSSTFWEAGDYPKSRPRYAKIRTPEYLKRHNFFEKLWGYHRYHDAHTSRYGHIKEVDRGNWITIANLETLREAFIDPLTDEDVMELVHGFRHSGVSMWGRPIKLRLPLIANKWHAWLIGAYYSAGSVYHYPYDGKRNIFSYPTVRIQVYEDVIPKIMEVARKIGTRVTVQNETRRYPKGGLKPLGIINQGFRTKTKATGLRTLRRRYIKLGWPLFYILQKFGLHNTKTDRTGHASRCDKPEIPEWIKSDDECMHMFIEGYLQGPRGASTLAPSSDTTPAPHLEIMIKVKAVQSQYAVNFAKDIQDWFTKKGIGSTIRKAGSKEGNVPEYIISMGSKEAIQFFIDNFDIRNTPLRARLHIKHESEKNKLLNMILSELWSPENVVLGMILEQPISKKQISSTLTMRPEGVNKAIQMLMNKGVIVCRNQTYYYNPAKYIQEKAYLRDQLIECVRKLQSNILSQCQNCQTIYYKPQVRCGICGGKVTSVERRKIIRKIGITQLIKKIDKCCQSPSFLGC